MDGDGGADKRADEHLAWPVRSPRGALGPRGCDLRVPGPAKGTEDVPAPGRRDPELGAEAQLRGWRDRGDARPRLRPADPECLGSWPVGPCCVPVPASVSPSVARGRPRRTGGAVRAEALAGRSQGCSAAGCQALHPAFVREIRGGRENGSARRLKGPRQILLTPDPGPLILRRGPRGGAQEQAQAVTPAPVANGGFRVGAAGASGERGRPVGHVSGQHPAEAPTPPWESGRTPSGRCKAQRLPSTGDGGEQARSVRAPTSVCASVEPSGGGMAAGCTARAPGAPPAWGAGATVTGPSPALGAHLRGVLAGPQCTSTPGLWLGTWGEGWSEEAGGHRAQVAGLERGRGSGWWRSGREAPPTAGRAASFTGTLGRALSPHESPPPGRPRTCCRCVDGTPRVLGTPPLPRGQGGGHRWVSGLARGGDAPAATESTRSGAPA
ncbi:hypothetical protein VULLAG_LOCUS2481 [Vulpes lagopus]